MIYDFAEKTGFSIDEILGKRRNIEIVAARHLYWKILFDAGFTTQEIAHLCDSNHATVLHGVRLVIERIEIGDKVTMGVWNKVKGIAEDYVRPL